ncbi:MAG: hypothetical protein JWR50_2409 [Mucilaginibacter sp.]|nr:hypothetical protein [Mucilaginibacter sp.]
MNLKRKISGVLFIVAIFISYSIRSYAQDRICIKKENLLKYKILSIKDLKCKYSFDNGRLISEFYYNHDQEIDNVKYRYYNDSLIIGDIDLGGGTEQHVREYKLKNKKLVSSVQINSHYNEDYTVEQNYEYFYKYFYNSNGSINRYSIFNKDGKRTTKTGSVYYLYNNSGLIGYFPAKNEASEKIDQSDTIYFQSKLNELKKIGMEKFKQKYFKGDIYKKVIADCYLPIKNEDLLINGKPVKYFLSKIKMSNVKYLVFEFLDNRFLFYKLID